MKTPANIIFDLGGVLINLNFDNTTNAFRELGFPNFENMFSQFKADQLFEKLEKGQIDAEDFLTVLQKVGKHGISNEQIKIAWNSMLLDFREESLAFLIELSKTCNLFLLSNTNAIHFDAFNQILKEQTGKDSLEPYFKKTYYSHHIGLRKPNNDIFDFVLKDARLTAAETLFIDDTSSNIETAQKMGFQTHLLLPEERIEMLNLEK